MTNKYQSFESKYPKITRFSSDHGYVEIGVSNPYVNAFIKAYDEGGTVWEGKDDYESIDEALKELEHGLSKWFCEVLGEYND